MARARLKKTPDGNFFHAAAPVPAPPALVLQRAIGNRATAQVLARRTAAKPRQTGIRADSRVHEYARRAHNFFKLNAGSELDYYGRFLGAAVNVQLETVGVPAVKVTIKNDVMVGAAAQFDAFGWEMTVAPAQFSNREGVTTIGDLTAHEAALIAMTFFHEGRHAEQNFRAAQLVAEQGGDPEMDLAMDPDAAAAATKDPLSKRTGALERTEAARWRGNFEGGVDGVYREAVTWWSGEIRRAWRMAKDVKPADAEATRASIGRIIRGWSKPDGAADFVKHHMTDAKARAKTKEGADVLADSTLIMTALPHVHEALGLLDEDIETFKPLADALLKLGQAVSKAYSNVPVEADAYETGNAVYDAFMAQEAAPKAAK